MERFIWVAGLIVTAALTAFLLSGCGYTEHLDYGQFKVEDDGLFTSDGVVWELKSDLTVYMQWKTKWTKTDEPVPKGKTRNVKKGQEFVVFEAPKDHIMKIRLVEDATDWYMWMK